MGWNLYNQRQSGNNKSQFIPVYVVVAPMHLLPSYGKCISVKMKNLNWRASKLNRRWKYTRLEWYTIESSPGKCEEKKKTFAVRTPYTTWDYSFDFMDRNDTVNDGIRRLFECYEVLPKRYQIIRTTKKIANWILLTVSLFTEIHCLLMSTCRRQNIVCPWKWAHETDKEREREKFVRNEERRSNRKSKVKNNLRPLPSYFGRIFCYLRRGWYAP